MKGNHWFIAGIIVFLVLMFAIECRLPKKFVWNPTFSHYDKQPFGCAVFDSLLSSSLPKGYSLSRKTFYELEQEDTTLRRGILVVTDNLHLTDVDVEAMLKMAGRGDRIMLAGSSFSRILKDTLGFECSYSYFSPSALKNMPLHCFRKTVCAGWGIRRFIRSRLSVSIPNFVSLISLQIPFLVKCWRKNCYRRSCSSGCHVGFLGKRGSYTGFHSPAFYELWCAGWEECGLSFSYIVPDGWISHCPYRRLYERNSPGTDVSFRYFLSQPPLRWALYLSMVSILLFMIFTARRKQRTIPVIREPENKSLEFAELIGTLYYQKKDHADLVRKKYLYFAEELRREIQVDVEEVAEDERSFGRIARKTGMEAGEIAAFIREVRPVVYGGRSISEEEMKRLIDRMNEIINHI